ncbi:putative tail tube associated base plate protein [Acinetobacter phage SH-Ab 15599]|nr:putative tail tube associated base plate protein [Acinetobacter phage SH-Ab 15599]
MATSVAERIKQQLSNDKNDNQSKIKDQLVLPTDLLNREDHSGLVVMFELNAIDYNKDSSNATNNASTKTNNKSSLTSKNTTGVENTEVEMQKKGNSTNAGSVRSSLPGYRKTGQSIVLPPPDQWIENLNVGWSQTEFGALARNAELVQSVVQGDYAGAGQQVAAAAPSVLAKVAGRKGSNLSKVADGAKRYVELMAGIRANDFTEMLFSNVNNRMIPFQFTLTPRNLQEAETMQLLIHRLKQASLPELWVNGTDNGSYFRAPYTFDISFVDAKSGKRSKYWTKLQTCALTNINVNRTPNGGMSIIKSPEGEYIPQSVVIELQFVELLRLVRDANDDPNESY